MLLVISGAPVVEGEPRICGRVPDAEGKGPEPRREPPAEVIVAGSAVLAPLPGGLLANAGNSLSVSWRFSALGCLLSFPSCVHFLIAERAPVCVTCSPSRGVEAMVL